MASLSMDSAVSCEKNNMSGLYIGLGANVGYDEYDASASVGYKHENAIKSVTVEETANETDITIQNGDADELVNNLWNIVDPNTITAKVNNHNILNGYIPLNVGLSQPINQDWSNGQCNDPTSSEAIYSPVYGSIDEFNPVGNLDNFYRYDKGYETGDTSTPFDQLIMTGNQYKGNFGFHFHTGTPCNVRTIYDIQYGNDNTYLNELFFKRESNEPSSIKNGGQDMYQVKIYHKQKVDISYNNYNATYLMSQSLNRSGHNAGGEMKMAYFHDFGNHVMAGLDLTGAVLSKNKRNVQVSKFNVNDVYPDLTLNSAGVDIAKAVYNNNKREYQTEVTGEDKVIAGGSPLTLSAGINSFKSAAMQANPGMQVTSEPIPETYLDVSNGDKEVSFEKGIFNPKLAFVIGGTYNGWFAGLRAGVSYNTGKIKAPDMTSSKSVSIASPLVGVQVMKKVSDNTNLYMTADWNVGDLRKSVDMNGIKSFKQSSYSISAGVQWKLNLFK